MEAKVDSAAMPGMAYGKQGKATRCQLPGYRWQCLTVEPGQGPSVARHTASKAIGKAYGKLANTFWKSVQ